MSWKRFPLRAKLCCCLIGCLLLALSALLVLGTLFNRSMDLVDKRLQDYYNIVAFSDAFTSADHALESATRRSPASRRKLLEFQQLRQEADGYLAKLTAKLSAYERERYLLVNAIASGYAAYMEEADQILALLAQDSGEEPGRRYFAANETISGYIQKYIPELLMQEIGRGQDLYAASRRQVNDLLQSGVVAFATLHILAVCLMMYLIGAVFFAPVQQIVAAMQRLEAGDFDVPDIPVQTEDETAQLIRVFNTMKRSTRELVLALREKSELEQALHLQAEEAARIRQQLEAARYAKLKSQVKPHFLFNTLNIISRVAREEQAETTERLIVSLARLFRYSLDTDAPYVTLAREIKCVNDYMRIQEIRFGDRLRFCWRIDPQLDPGSVFVVPYTLQPLVENAIIHGLRDTVADGRLRITLRLRPDGLTICITDNGRGIDRSQLCQLQAAVPPPDDGHIGIQNVRSRLRHFRPDSQLRLYSYPNHGTCVKIVIPQGRDDLEDIGG